MYGLNFVMERYQQFIFGTKVVDEQTVVMNQGHFDKQKKKFLATINSCIERLEALCHDPEPKSFDQDKGHWLKMIQPLNGEFEKHGEHTVIFRE